MLAHTLYQPIWQQIAFSAQLTTMPMTIERIIKKAQQGDEGAISALYERHVDAIYRYILYRTPTAVDAEDLTAEVFLRMVEGLPRYRMTGVPFEVWLYRIAAARIADFYRARQRSPESDIPEQLADHIPLPEEQLLQNQEVEALRQVIAQFSDEEQTILVMRFVERKSHKEVAQVLGKSAGAVKAAQHRALLHLAVLLGSEEKVRHYLRGSSDD
jgi:RNA polymerase sigma-70 factor, ECF subfamily